MGNLMVSVSSVFGSGVDSLGNPVNYSFLSKIADFFVSLLLAIPDGIMWLIYLIMRFILNIVDFMQYFVKKLVGLDYWGTERVSADTLGESDVIFRFLYNDQVQRVFRIMLGVFVVLLIIFTIVAIVKSEYNYASSEDGKGSNDNKGIMVRSLKAIVLVILMPIMIVMGILASNAILTSLVNAFNINNKLTMGSQIFTASAYDANKYRVYASKNIRLPATNNVAVTIGGTTKYISSAVTTIEPMHYNSANHFYGFMFQYNGAEYLYYVNKDELESDYEFYIKYFEQIGAPLVMAGNLGCPSLSGKPYALDVSLHAQEESTRLVQAAYRTWYYNELLTRDTLTFDKTVTGVREEFTSASGNVYADAYVYTNNALWGSYHDGGTNGLVALPSEYYVMADIIDFMINDVVEMSIVNINNPLINWNYNGEGGYINNRYVANDFYGSSKSFMVNYRDSGYTIYQPNLNASKEEEGAIFIMAYYSSRDNQYIPVVNNRAYIDDYGDSHTFSSNYLDPSYEGLIVARGVLTTVFSNRDGTPTQITTGYNSDASGNAVALDEPYYVQATVESSATWAEKTVDFSVGFNTRFTGLNGNTLVAQPAGGVNNINSYSLKQIAQSLPTSLNFIALDESGNATRQELTGLSWTLGSKSDGSNSVSIDFDGSGSKTYYMFISNQTVSVHIDNIQFGGSTDGSLSIRSVPLICFVNINSGGTSGNIYFAYSQYNSSDLGWITATPNRDVNIVGDSLYSSYNIATGGGTSSSNGLIARLLAVTTAGNANLSAPIGGGSLPGTGYDHPPSAATSTVAFISSGSLGFSAEKTSLDQEDGNIFNLNKNSYGLLSKLANVNVSVDGTSSAQEIGFQFTRLGVSVNQILPTLDGSILSTSNITANSSRLTISNPSFREITSERIEYSNGNVTYFFALYTGDNMYRYSYGGSSYPIIVRVSFNASDNSLSVLAMDLFHLYLRDGASGGSPISAGSQELNVSIYDMEYVGAGSGYTTYRYAYSSGQYLYFNFVETVSGNGIYDINEYGGPNDPYEMYKLTINTYNLFAFRVDGTGGSTTYYQYNPNTDTTSNSLTVISTQSYYVRPSNISFGRATSTDAEGNSIYIGTIYREDASSATGEGSIIATVYYSASSSADIPSNDKENAVTNAYMFVLNEGTFSRIPNYSSREDALNILTELEPNIRFVREYVTLGVWHFDFSLNILNLFGEGPTWRFELGFFQGAGDKETETLAFTIENGRLFLDYNFNNVAGLDVNTFFVPGRINVLILVFATILVLVVMGQAVWGLVARIYDITIYFLVMPGIVSAMPLDNGKMYSNWQSNLVKKVLGAYGVMIGLNFFFILIPAIRDASQLFTDYDLQTNISQGSWLAGLSADAVNSLVYILFLLVAFTLIKTLPKTISGMIGAEDAYSNGADVKEKVKSTVNEVGKHVSGQAAMETVDSLLGKKDKKDKDGRRYGGFLKNFVPGSAIYDKWKKNHPKGKKSDRADAGMESGGSRTPSPAAPTPEAPESVPGTQEPQEATSSSSATETQTRAPQLQGTETGASVETAEANAGAENFVEAQGFDAQVSEAASDAVSEELPKLTKNEAKLQGLMAERADLLEAQQSGEVDFGIRGRNAQKAFDEFNEGKAEADKIFDENNAETLSAAYAQYMKNHDVDLNNMSGRDKGFSKMRNEALQEYKETLVQNAWNSKHADMQIDKQAEAVREEALKRERDADNERRRILRVKQEAGTITNEERTELANLSKKTYTNEVKEQNDKLIEQARNDFDKEQDLRMKEAKFNFKNSELDNKIAELETRVALEQNGLGKPLKGRWGKKRTSEEIGRHEAEQAEARKAYEDALKLSEQEATADDVNNLDMAKRREMVEKFNKSRKKGEKTFANLDTAEQNAALQDAINAERKEAVKAARASLEKANAVVMKDSEIYNGTPHGLRLRKLNKLNANLDSLTGSEVLSAEDVRSKRQTRNLSAKADKSKAARESNEKLEEANRQVSKRISDSRANIEKLEKELNAARANRTNIGKGPGSEEAQKRVKELETRLKSEVQTYNESVAERNKNQKQIDKNNDAINDYSATANRIEARGERNIRKQIVKERKKLQKQFKTYGENMSPEQQQKLISAIAKKDAKLQEIDANAGRRGATRYKKAKTEATSKMRFGTLMSKQRAKSRQAEKALRKGLNADKKRQKMTDKFNKKNSAQATQLQETRLEREASRKAYEQEHTKLSARYDASKVALSRAESELQRKRAELEQHLLNPTGDKKADSERTKALKGDIDRAQEEVDRRRKESRAAEKAMNKAEYTYNRSVGISFLNKENKLKYKRQQALQAQKDKLSKHLQANADVMSIEDQATVASQISGIDSAINELNLNAPRYKKVSKKSVVKKDLTIMTARGYSRAEFRAQRESTRLQETRLEREASRKAYEQEHTKLSARYDASKVALSRAESELQRKRAELEQHLLNPTGDKKADSERTKALKGDIDRAQEEVDRRRKESRAAEKAMNKAEYTYNRSVGISFLNKENKLKYKRQQALQAQKDKLSKHLQANADVMSIEDQATVASQISGIDSAINELNLNAPRYKKVSKKSVVKKDLTTMTAYGYSKAESRAQREAIRAGKAEAKEATRSTRDAISAVEDEAKSRVKAAKKVKIGDRLKTAEKVGARSSEIDRRAGESAVRASEVVETRKSHIRVGSERIQKVVDGKQATQLRMALTRNGEAAMVRDILKKHADKNAAFTREKTEAHIKRLEKKLQSGMASKREQVRLEQLRTALAQYDKQKAGKITEVLGKNVKVKGGTVKTDGPVVASGNVTATGRTTATGASSTREAGIAKALDDKAAAAIRSGYLKAFNNLIRQDKARGGRPVKSAAKAYEASRRYQQVLAKAKSDIETRLKEGKTKVPLANEQLKKIETQISELKKLNSSLESNAKKMKKQVSELMRDKRNNKYQKFVTPIKDTRNPDPGGK